MSRQVVCLLAMVAVAAPSIAQVGTPAAPVADLKVLVMEATEDYVLKSGTSVKVLGSWVNPKGDYRSRLTTPKGFSDHDITVLFNGDDAEALRVWKDAQREIRANVERRLLSAGVAAEQAAQVASETINIYPPRQLVAGVESADDAVKRFSELGLKPGLTVEGTWGAGALAQQQAYELKAGRVLYRDGSQVRKGFTDLTHLQEGPGTYGLKATVNLSDQFSAKALEALEQGASGAKDVLKDMDRLNQYLRKAKSDGRLAMEFRSNPELQGLLDDWTRVQADMKAELDALRSAGNQLAVADRITEAQTAWLKVNRATVAKAVGQARMDVDLLKMLSQATNPKEIDLLYRALERGGQWAKITEGVSAAATATGVAAGTIFQELSRFIIAAEAYGVAKVAVDQGLNAATIDAGLRVIRFTNLPAGLLEMALEQVKEGGFGFVARSQDCLDLVAGIYSVKGREGEGKGDQIDALARRFTIHQEVQPIVERHARLAASRGFSKDLTPTQQAVEASVEEGIARELTARCVPTVLMAWRAEREALAAKVIQARLDLERELAPMMLIAEATVADKGEKVAATVRIRPTVDPKRLRDRIAEMARALGVFNATATAGEFTANGTALWTVNGRIWQSRTIYDFAPPEPETFELAKGASHDIALEYRVDLKPFAIQGNLPLYKPGNSWVSSEQSDAVFTPYFARRYVLHSAVTVDPGDEAGTTTDEVETAVVLSRLEARVMDRATSLPIGGASVLLEGAGYRESTGTGADGNAAIDRVPVGSYNITVKADGYKTATRYLFRFEPDTIKRGTVWLTPADRPATTDLPAVTRPSAEKAPAPIGATAHQQLSFGGGFIPLSATPSPQVFSHDVPGPGTLTVTFTYTPLEHVSLEYGAGRTEASLRWTSPTVKGLAQVGPVVRVKGGVAVSEPATKTVAIVTSGPETIVFSVMPEVTTAYQFQGKWIDLNSRTWSTHHHLLAASGTVTLAFTPAVPRP